MKDVQWLHADRTPGPWVKGSVYGRKPEFYRQAGWFIKQLPERTVPAVFLNIDDADAVVPVERGFKFYSSCNSCGDPAVREFYISEMRVQMCTACYDEHFRKEAAVKAVERKMRESREVTANHDG